MRWAGHVAHIGEKRSAYKVLVDKIKGKIPLARPRRRWEEYLNRSSGSGRGNGLD
jgi:hypothetical protein